MWRDVGTDSVRPEASVSKVWVAIVLQVDVDIKRGTTAEKRRKSIQRGGQQEPQAG